MLDLAKHIVEHKSASFEPKRFEDRYEAALIGRSAAAFGAGEARAEDRRQRHQPDGMRSSGG
jgi:non-homologous end joining protein Ku